MLPIPLSQELVYRLLLKKLRWTDREREVRDAMGICGGENLQDMVPRIIRIQPVGGEKSIDFIKCFK